MAWINRAAAQNLAALTVGGLLAVAVATALTHAERSTRKDIVQARAQSVATELRTDAHALLDAIAPIDLAQTRIDAEAAKTLLDATPPGDATLEVLGVAMWRRDDGGLTLERAYEAAHRNSAFRGVIDTHLQALDDAFEAAATAPRPAKPATIVELSLAHAGSKPQDRLDGPIALDDPAPFDGVSFWLVWESEDEARRAALRISVERVLGAIDRSAPIAYDLLIGAQSAATPQSGALSLLPSRCRRPRSCSPNRASCPCSSPTRPTARWESRSPQSRRR